MNKSVQSNNKVISFPYMGNITIALKAAFEKMGAQVVVPPDNNKNTLTLGTRYSCETVCLPYKLNLGNYIQALEAGANVLIMFQAPGTCRLGNYASTAEAKLKELGYEFEMIVFDMYKGKVKEIATKFSGACGNKNLFKTISGIQLSLAKIYALDQIEKKLFYIRPREIVTGKAERIYNQGKTLINGVNELSELKKVVDFISNSLDQIEINKNKNVIKIYITGEFFVLLDPYTNMEIEKELGLLGVEVERQIMLSDWISSSILPKWINNNESHRERSQRIASSYIKRAIGGECLESIGDAVYAAEKQIDGVIHLGPFNCNPEIVSQCILPHVSKKENIPIISLIMDEHTGKAGFTTRLEAFVDLVNRKKSKKGLIHKEVLTP